MILLVTGAKARKEFAQVLEVAMAETVVVAETVRKAATLARSNDYTAIVLDDPMVETELDAMDALMNNTGISRVASLFFNRDMTS